MGAAGIAWGPQQRVETRLQIGPGCQTYQDLDKKPAAYYATTASMYDQGHTCKRWHMCPDTQTCIISPPYVAKKKCRPGDPLKYGCLRAELADPQRSSSACLTGGPA